MGEVGTGNENGKFYGIAWAPGSKWVYVCSEHFQTGKKILIVILYSLANISCITANYK